MVAHKSIMNTVKQKRLSFVQKTNPFYKILVILFLDDKMFGPNCFVGSDTYEVATCF